MPSNGSRHSPLFDDEADLGFDPFLESQKGIQELIDAEKSSVGQAPGLPSGNPLLGLRDLDMLDNNAGLGNLMGIPRGNHPFASIGQGQSGRQQQQSLGMGQPLPRAKAPPPGFGASGGQPNSKLGLKEIM